MTKIPKLETAGVWTILANAAYREDAAGRDESAQFLRSMSITTPANSASAIMVAIIEAMLERERQLIFVVNALIDSLDVDLDTISPEIIENVSTLLMAKYIDRTTSPTPTAKNEGKQP